MAAFGILWEICCNRLAPMRLHEPRHFKKIKWFVIYLNGTVPAGATAPLKMVAFPYMQ